MVLVRRSAYLFHHMDSISTVEGLMDWRRRQLPLVIEGLVQVLDTDDNLA